MRHLRPFLRSLVLLPFVLAASCGGSGGANGTTAPAPGSVLVTVDTATGSDALVQFQVDGAVLVYADGSTTPNLLRNPHMVRLADPTGAPDGLVLGDAPSGDYTELRLFVVPDSGSALQPSGTILPARTVVDLVVPITDGLQHTSLATSWLVIGHNGQAPAVGSTADWLPQMTARADGASIALDDLDVAFVDHPAVVTRSGLHQDAALRITFADDCVFTGSDDGAHTDPNRFLDNLGDDQLRIKGDLRRDGRCVAREAHRSGRNDNPRLIGRILALEAATASFVMSVQAQNPRGGWVLDPAPERVRIDASRARLHRPNHQPIQFSALQLNHLVKVKWISRSQPAGELPRLVASEVEVVASPAAMQPEWQGRVHAVDTVARTITVRPRNDDPIVVGGVSLSQVTLQVDDGTHIERRARHGNGRSNIQLGDIVPDADRIWWRGTVTGPTTIDATWVRVREQ